MYVPKTSERVRGGGQYTGVGAVVLKGNDKMRIYRINDNKTPDHK